MREFVILTPDQYPQFLKFQLNGESNAAILDPIPQGSTVSVEFYCTGREWEGKYFVGLVAVGVTAVSAEESGEILDAGTISNATVVATPTPANDQNNDDLPF